MHESSGKHLEFVHWEHLFKSEHKHTLE